LSIKDWEQKVLAAPGAADRVTVIEDELRMAAGLTALREGAGLSQRELAKRIGISQPRIAAIERSRNVTLDVLEQYVTAVGGQLEITVRTGSRKLALVGPHKAAPAKRTAVPPPPAARRKKPAKTA
jgi:transcriptional regulator with XRE-family HTH domain